MSEAKTKIKPKQQSTTDFLKMAFTPPKKDIVEMMTPKKEPVSTEITPYIENKSFLDFVMGGSAHKREQQLKTDKKVKRLKELKHNITKPKQLFEYNDLKTEITNQPNPNKEIASGIIQRIAKSKLAQKELINKQIQASIENQAGSIITKSIKNKIARKDFKNAKDTYDPATHQDKIRDKRKEFARIMTTQTKTKKAKEDAQKKV